MSTRFRRSTHEYELLPRASLESDEFPDLERRASNSPTSWLGRLTTKVPGVSQLSSRSGFAQSITPRRRLRSVPRTIYWTVFFLPYFIVFLVLFVGIVFPSYTHRPAHYNELRKLAQNTTLPGRANTRNEKVFIAASIYEKDGELTSGAWGKSVLHLVDLLGPENTYLSIYENDPDTLTRKSLTEFKRNVTCNSSITFEDLDMSTLPRVTLPTGETRIKRIAFLAEVRNRALAPIDRAGVRFDRILYINDVNFDPVEAAQLLFSTNVDATGRANYGAACALDFINAFKFYDRFASRDLDGYDMGIPFFPFFTVGDTATSRNDIIAGTDAVRVRSCWGGMTAFEAKWFQDQTPFDRDSSSQSVTPSSPNPNLNLAPIRFRYSEDAMWEASECCLVNGDLQYRRSGVAMPEDSGVYMNPFIRVAYDTKTLSWLSLTRRPERLYSLVHRILNPMVGFPHQNSRRLEEPGTTVQDTVWQFDDPVAAFKPDSTNEQRSGHNVEVSRIVEPGGFCGGRFLLVMNEDNEQGKGKWGKINLPGPPA